MLKDKFIHLHIHSDYSLLDGACKIEEIIRKVKEYKMSAVALTDHGNLFGALEFYDVAIANGIKPILGCEVYVAPGSRKEHKPDKYNKTNYHLTLLVESEKGYRNLVKLISISYIEGFYYKPRIDKEILAHYAKGLICLSGCTNSELYNAIAVGDLARAEEICETYRSIFGKDNFYIELQRNKIEGQDKYLEEALKIGRKMEIPFVATNDCHYINKEDAKAQDILLCIATNKKVYEKDRMRFATDEFYIKSAEEMSSLFQDVPQALKETVNIAERVNFKANKNEFKIPNFNVPDKFDSPSFLRKLCEEGLEKRYPTGISVNLRNRLNYELEVITRKNFCDYFLIVWDIVRFAKSNGIPVGPGRGSAAGSLVSYSLGITDIDPIKYNLIFERFLSPDRDEYPDIDIDFAPEGRGKVIEYIYNKYGRENVANITTFGTMGARAVIRDVGRVLDIPLPEVDEIAKKIPNNIGLKEALEIVPGLQTTYNTNARIRELFDLAMKLEGLHRHSSTHAAGIVISNKPLDEYIPIYIDKENELKVTQYSMEVLQKLGLPKIDILGLKNLSVIHKTLEFIEKYRGIKINLPTIPMDDQATYNLLKTGKTKGVFQLESTGMQDLCRKVQPTCFEDIIAILALYRPGTLQSGMVDTYIEYKNKKSEIQYLHPMLKDILEETNGVIVYQEQVMQIAHRLGGLAMTEANVLRKAMSKKEPELIEGYRNQFIEGCLKNGIKKDIAEQIFDLMKFFGGYGFNKSHSTAYAMISYYTAYLKANFTPEFMAALLTCECDNTDKIGEYISEIRNWSIEILPPDINKSEGEFTIESKNKDNNFCAIRFALSAIKGIGNLAVDNILKTREKSGYFKSFADFCYRVDAHYVNKEVVENLIKCGAFDSLGVQRNVLLAAFPELNSFISSFKDKKSVGQTTLLGSSPVDTIYDELIKKYCQSVGNLSTEEIISYERNLLGIPISQDPLLTYEEVIRTYTTTSSARLKETDGNMPVIIAGIIESVKNRVIKSGASKGRSKLTIRLRDLDGFFEAHVYPEEMTKYLNYIVENQVIFILGKKNTTTEVPSVKVNKVIPVNEVKSQLTKVIELDISNKLLNEEDLILLKDIISKYKGTSKVVLKYTENGKTFYIKCSDEYRVSVSDAFLDEIDKLLGNGSYQLKPQIS